MKAIDIVFIIILLLGAWKGYTKGFFREIISFLVLFVSIILAFKYLNKGMEFLSEYISNSVLLKTLTFLSIFILILVTIHILSKIFKKLLDLTFFGQIDNIAGAFLGILKMAFICSLFLWLIIHSHIFALEQYVVGSLLYEPIINFAPKLVHWTTLIFPFDDIFPVIKSYLSEA